MTAKTRTGSLLLLIATQAACVHRGDDRSGARADAPPMPATATTAPAPACDGEAATYILAALPDPNDPALPHLEFPPFTTFTFEPVSPDADNAVQLNICVANDDSVTLQSVKYLYFGRMLALDVGADARVNGLQEALFGNVADLDVRIPTHTQLANVGAAYVLKGFAQNGIRYVAATEIYLRDGSDSPFDERVMIGKLQAGQVAFPDQGPCAGGETYREVAFKIMSGEFTAKYCTWPTPDRSGAVRLLDVTVTDAGPNAPAGFSQHFSQRSDFDGPDAPCIYDWTHHNMNDKFVCKTTAGVYSAVKSGLFGNFRVTRKVVYANGQTDSLVQPNCGGVFGCDE
jgi:hypothetical protein